MLLPPFDAIGRNTLRRTRATEPAESRRVSHIGRASATNCLALGFYACALFFRYAWLPRAGKRSRAGCASVFLDAGCGGSSLRQARRSSRRRHPTRSVLSRRMASVARCSNAARRRSSSSARARSAARRACSASQRAFSSSAALRASSSRRVIASRTATMSAVMRGCGG